MLGMMKLLDIIRARIPTVDINSNTVPRMNRTTPSTSAMSSRFTQSIPTPNSLSNHNTNGGTVSRNSLTDEENNQPSASRVSAASLSHTSPSMTPIPPVQQSTGSFSASQLYQTSQRPSSPSVGGNSQTAYPDKIRAVSIQINNVIGIPQLLQTKRQAEQQIPLRTRDLLPRTLLLHHLDTPMLQRLLASWYLTGLLQVNWVGTAHAYDPGI